jgi:aspartyl protease family protein
MFGLNDDQSVRLVYLCVLLAILVGSIGFGRGRSTARFRHLGVWVLVAVALVALYAYRDQVMRVAAPVMREIAPSRVAEVTTPGGARELVITRADDGHFHVDGKANGASVRFLVDTGATGTVLTMEDARRAGIDVDSIAFNRPVQTANGTAFYASATLDSLTIGPEKLTSVPVGVMPGDAMDTSLLGMSTIDRFSGWRVEGDQMVLVPK